MKINCLVIFVLTLILNSLVFAEFKQSNLIPPKNCSDVICVRNNIDMIDAEIVKLIGLRLTYVERAGVIKGNKQAIHDQKRENQILDKVSKLALKEGYPGSIATEIYKTLLIQANEYEKEAQKSTVVPQAN